MADRLKKLEELLKNDPTDSFLLFAIAKELESRGETENAIRVFEQLRKSNRDYAGLYFHLAKLYTETNQLDIALNIYILGVDVCKEQGDQHALAELQNAKLNFELEHF